MKFQLFLYFSIYSFLFSSCSIFLHNSANNSQPDYPIDILAELSERINLIQGTQDFEKLEALTNWVNNNCSKNFKVDSSSYSFIPFLKKIEEFNSIDAFKINFTSDEKRDLLQIAVYELQFKAIVAIQHNLFESYNKLTAVDKYINSIIYATTNRDLSKTKTELLQELFNILSVSNISEIKIRCWIAIDRMLKEIDIEKSEFGDPIVQRSPYGIMIKKDEIINTLQFIKEKEFNIKVLPYAQNTINNIRDNTSKYEEMESQIVIGSLDNLVNRNKINDEAIVNFNKAVNSTNHRDKIFLYSKAIELDSNFIAAYNNRGITYFESNNFSNAIHDFQEVLRIDSTQISSFSYLANCYLKLNQYQSAIDNYNSYLTYKKSDITSYINRGLCNHMLGNDSAAIKDFSIAIKIDSNSVAAYTNRAQSYLAINRIDNAADDYIKLLSIDPNDGNNYYNLGCIFWKKNDWEKVIEIWEKGLIIDPNNSKILKNLKLARKYKLNNIK